MDDAEDARERAMTAIGTSHSPRRRILVPMTPSPSRRRHLASSPFKPDPEPVIEKFEHGDLVSHDTYGMGRVIGVDEGAVTVDFGRQTIHIKSPYPKMTKL